MPLVGGERPIARQAKERTMAKVSDLPSAPDAIGHSRPTRPLVATGVFVVRPRPRVAGDASANLDAALMPDSRTRFAWDYRLIGSTNDHALHGVEQVCFSQARAHGLLALARRRLLRTGDSNASITPRRATARQNECPLGG